MFLISKKNKGSVMVSVLTVLCLLSLLGGLLSRIVSTEFGAVGNFSEGISAQYVAEAGLRRGLVVLIGNGDPHGLSEVIQLQGKSVKYLITVTEQGSRTLIRSTGIAGTARRTISAEVSKAGSHALAEYVAVSTGSLDLFGDAVIRGPMIAGGPTGINDKSSSFSPLIEKARCLLPIVSKPSGYFETIPEKVNQEIALEGKTVVLANHRIVLAGASARVKGPGVLWVRGDLIMSGATVDQGAIIISEGNIRIESRSRLVGSLVAATKGTIDVDGDGIYVTGALWAKEHIDIRGNGSLLSSDSMAVKAAMDRLGISDDMRQPFVIHSWGI